ncbi:MAG TPA: hypothetical protein PKD79_02990 [Candidatus Doudnabacteria bacterium]|nr:hypothetical protein [Candidatus Doudnabacteria bacterium]
MSAFEKENIFVELREYHMNEFPESMASTQLDELRVEFGELEDSIVNMILSLVNGKAEFEDHSEELKTFREKLNAITADTEAEKSNKNFFEAKLSHLDKILNQTGRGTFPLRKQRPARISQSKKPVTIGK